jgi:hypothetical protein
VICGDALPWVHEKQPSSLESFDFTPFEEFDRCVNQLQALAMLIRADNTDEPEPKKRRVDGEDSQTQNAKSLCAVWCVVRNLLELPASSTPFTAPFRREFVARELSGTDIVKANERCQCLESGQLSSAVESRFAQSFRAVYLKLVDGLFPKLEFASSIGQALWCSTEVSWTELQPIISQQGQVVTTISIAGDGPRQMHRREVLTHCRVGVR